jgi:hypothetical protein
MSQLRSHHKKVAFLFLTTINVFHLMYNPTMLEQGADIRYLG